MRKHEPSAVGKTIVGLLIACGAFMGIAGTLGFLGWSQDPSSQKWAALSCGLMGWVCVLFFWKIKDDFIYPRPTPPEQEIENQPVEAQRRHWLGQILYAFVVGPVGCLLMWFSPPFFDQAPNLKHMGLLAVMTLAYILFYCYKFLRLWNSQ
jgi:sterol desaturase/sphingolipid hydroxylase (fatty acid hydroxylase superfamily)